MSEPLKAPPILFEPEGLAGDQVGSPPNLLVGGTDPDLIARIQPPAPEKKPDAAPAPVAPVQVQQGYTPDQLAQALVMSEAAKERRNRELAIARERAIQLAKTFEPPALPTGEAREKLILDENALAGVLEQNQQWTRNALGRMAEEMTNQFGQQLQAVEQRMLVPMYEQAADSAMSRAAEVLASMGVPDSGNVVGELDMRLRQGNPEAYWNVVTNPESLVMGARMLLMEKGMATQGPTAPISIGYTAGVQGQRQEDFAKDDYIRRIERGLNTTIRPEHMERYHKELEEQGIRR